MQFKNRIQISSPSKIQYAIAIVSVVFLSVLVGGATILAVYSMIKI